MSCALVTFLPLSNINYVKCMLYRLDTILVTKTSGYSYDYGHHSIQ